MKAKMAAAVCIGYVCLVSGCGSVDEAAEDAEPIAEEAQAFTFYCKKVVANTLTVYQSSTGYSAAYTLFKYDTFWATSSDNGRYHGQYWNTGAQAYLWGWISADPQWTNPVNCP